MMFARVMLGLCLAATGVGVAFAAAPAATPIPEQSCSEFTGTVGTESQLKQNIKSGEHESSAAHSVGKLLGNRLRQNNLATWVQGYLAGYAGGKGQPSGNLTLDDVKAKLQQHCEQHPQASMLEAAEALAQSQ